MMTGHRPPSWIVNIIPFTISKLYDQCNFSYAKNIGLGCPYTVHRLLETFTRNIYSLSGLYDLRGNLRNYCSRQMSLLAFLPRPIQYMIR